MAKLLPIDLYKACENRDISCKNTSTDPFIQQTFLCINLARVDPIFFSNNILEWAQKRYRKGNYYHSFSDEIQKTLDGVQKVNEAIDVLAAK